MKILQLLICFFICIDIYPNIDKYFKKCHNKEAFHTIRNIDFIYMINLDQRPEKYELSRKMLSQFGIYPYRFSAVNGWELSIETINDIGVKYEKWMRKDLIGSYYMTLDKRSDRIIKYNRYNYFAYKMSKGMIGIVLSHLSILQDAYDSNYDIIWVMEDDIEIIRNPHLISDMIDRLDNLVGRNKWDILFTDRDTKGKDGKYVLCFSYADRPNFTPKSPERFKNRKRISKDFINVGARYGAYSMILNRSGIKKILNFIKTYRIFLPYDMEYTLPEDIRLFSVVSDIVSTRPMALSDNETPTY